MDEGEVEKNGGGVCSSETVNGGEDVFSCDESDASSVDHLVIMVHGILGSATDWKFGAEQFVRRLPDKVFVHCSERNMAKLTLDGVDVMGERLSEEVLEVIKRKPGLKKISFVSHSVGGLVARYAIGRLYRPPRMENIEDLSANACIERLKGCTIAGLEPINFITVATPHLASRGNKQWEESLNEKYPHIVYEEHCKAYDGEQGESVVKEDDSLDKVEEELLTGLSKVSWDKVDVSFHRSRRKFAAHSVIQVKDPNMDAEGADVIQHMVDNFIV